eukprot:TRINITY_DN12603_c0_g1_i2.p1 TRINITY_DN12603_c0_g1~~TRINITY_DN12603_c0_g1_i2.p1  ORF type:complete len:420 (-),score=69.04 TRINITY_DN12603_c0_g1_i2:67-1326(-)
MCIRDRYKGMQKKTFIHPLGSEMGLYDAGIMEDGFVLSRSIIGKMRKQFKKRSMLVAKLKSFKDDILKKRPEYAALYTKLEESLNEFNSLEKLLNKTRDDAEPTENLIIDAKKYMETSSKLISKLNVILFLLSLREDCKELMGWYLYSNNNLVMVNLKSKENCYVEMPEDKLINYNDHLIGAPSTVKIDSTFYFMGGFDGENVVDTVYKLLIHNIPTDLIELAPLKLAKYDIAAAQLCKKYLLAITGTLYIDGNEVHTRDCERYDIASNQWTNIHPLNKGRAIAGMCVFNDRFIFVYGGQMDDSSYSSDLETYDILDDENGWTIYKNSDFDIPILLTTSGLAQQISNDEIMLLSTRKVQILKVSREKAFKVTTKDKDYENLFYSCITCYNGKVYWSTISKVACYNLLTKDYAKTLNLID